MENSYAEDIAVGVEKAVGVAILRRRQFYTDDQFHGLKLNQMYTTISASACNDARDGCP
jgi:hypothetical protein